MSKVQAYCTGAFICAFISDLLKKCLTQAHAHSLLHAPSVYSRAVRGELSPPKISDSPPKIVSNYYAILIG